MENEYKPEPGNPLEALFAIISIPFIILSVIVEWILTQLNKQSDL